MQFYYILQAYVLYGVEIKIRYGYHHFSYLNRISFSTKYTCAYDTILKQLANQRFKWPKLKSNQKQYIIHL